MAVHCFGELATMSVSWSRPLTEESTDHACFDWGNARKHGENMQTLYSLHDLKIWPFCCGATVLTTAPPLAKRKCMSVRIQTLARSIEWMPLHFLVEQWQTCFLHTDMQLSFLQEKSGLMSRTNIIVKARFTWNQSIFGRCYFVYSRYNNIYFRMIDNNKNVYCQFELSLMASFGEHHLGISKLYCCGLYIYKLQFVGLMWLTFDVYHCNCCSRGTINK